MVVLVGLCLTIGSISVMASPQPLRVLVLSTNETTLLPKLIREFEVQTGRKVETEAIPHGELMQKMMLSLVSRSPDYDVVAVATEYFGSLQPHLEPLDGYIKTTPAIDMVDYLPGVIQQFTSHGKVYALPWYVNVLLGVYRTDIFRTKGLKWPTTWTEYAQVAEKATDRANNISGATFPGRVHAHLTIEWVQRYWSKGGELFDDDGRPTFATEAGIEAVDDMLDLIYERNAVPPGFLERSYIEDRSVFMAGCAAMGWFWPGQLPILNDPRSSAVVGKWAVGVRPGTPWASVWAFGIPKYSRNKADAYKLIYQLTNKEASLYYAMNGVPQARRSSMENREVLAKTPYFKEVATSLARSKTAPAVDNWPKIDEILARNLSRAISRETSPREALAAAENEVKKTVK